MYELHISYRYIRTLVCVIFSGTQSPVRIIYYLYTAVLMTLSPTAALGLSVVEQTGKSPTSYFYHFYHCYLLLPLFLVYFRISYFRIFGIYLQV